MDTHHESLRHNTEEKREGLEVFNKEGYPLETTVNLQG
jgi:hypothetical protein